MPDARLKVVLADDHHVVREGLKMLVNGQADMVVVGEASNGEEAIEATRTLRPDVVVMDVSMPVLGGIEATRRVRSEFPDVQVIALTVHEERSYLTELLSAGVSGYVLKRAAAADLVMALRTVATGALYLDPNLSDGLNVEVDREPSFHREADTLSDRERDVLKRTARGFSNKEIAADLRISVKTVETYKARMLEKLGIRTRVEIIRYASSRGWLDDPD